ncbi:MAG: glycosyltransferase family 2 protein [Saprospiraceae bacterium]|nr:glycosyltransferase family 2 protein [Saprospiraceae bacterium]
MSMAHPSVAVVLLNYNSLKYLKEFLPALVAHTPEWVELVIIDNASTQQAWAWVAEHYPQIRWVQFHENYGYAGGYQRGLQEVHADYYVLLNIDVEVTKNWLEPVISAFEADSSIGAAQPKILAQTNKAYFEHAGSAGGFIDQFGYPFCRGRVFDHLEVDTGQYDEAIDCFWASGAALFVRSNVFKEVGGFDERFFAHMEEIDFCWRVQKAGYSVKCFPESIVYHVGGGVLDYAHPRKAYLNFRNNLIMCFKQWSILAILWKLPIRLFLDAIAAWRFLLTGKPAGFLAVAKAHLHFFAGIFKWRQKANNATSPRQVRGILKKSIVFQYFVLGKKTYTQLTR